MAFSKSLDSLDLTTFGGRLYHQAILLCGSLNSFAKQNNLLVDTLQTYVANKNVPNLTMLMKLKSAGLDLDYLMYGTNGNKAVPIKIESHVDKSVVAVPKFTSPARGGVWNMIDNDNHSTVFMPDWTVKGIKNPAMVEVVGMSMSPEIEYKDVVIFDMKKEVKDKDVVICTYDSNTMIKKYRKKDGVITLESTNPKNKPIIISDELVIHGVVIKVIHDMTKKREAF